MFGIVQRLGGGHTVDHLRPRTLNLHVDNGRVRDEIDAVVSTLKEYRVAKNV